MFLLLRVRGNFSLRWQRAVNTSSLSLLRSTVLQMQLNGQEVKADRMEGIAMESSGGAVI